VAWSSQAQPIQAVAIESRSVNAGTASANAQSDLVAGIFYLDSTGTVSNVSARNLPVFGAGILALVSTGGAQKVTVQNSVVRGLSGQGSFGSFGIVASVADGVLTANIKGNTIRCSNNWPAGICGNGIQVYKAKGIVESNAISETAMGIELIDSSVTATRNTISTSVIAVEVDSGSNTITGNQIDAGGGTGLSLGFDGTKSIVQGNTIVNSSIAIFGCDIPARYSTGFTVTGNTITDAAVGIQMPNPNGNITAPNKYYATATAVTPQQCF
jgi:hypothetical protein